MTTKPSDAPWANEPFNLIETPSIRLKDSHAYVRVASEMVHSHNCLIRGLNAIIQQAPNVPTALSPAYKAKDVSDLLFFVHSWTKMVHHHHWTEESFIFPEIESFSGRPGLMDNPKHQHELFQEGLDRLAEYASATKPGDYRWDGPSGMRAIVDSFSEPLIQHLYAEIDDFLALKDLDSAGLEKTWDKAEAVAKQTGNLKMLYDVFPCVLGCVDKTYEVGYDFPPLPKIVPYMIKYVFAAGNGAWRFSPCDFWGRPRPLVFAAPVGERASGAR
ncbi:hypothetical protein F4778DRAFT_529547 [Xylariomycetidae sp. FL2044]|nr:hypothetical protein F4778DRAFT_529547 [Xylariomycetidae sp. FL2044]